MIVESSEAYAYKCCAMDKQCEGNRCMAWKIHWVVQAADQVAFQKARFVPVPKFEDSGKGYCGLMK